MVGPSVEVSGSTSVYGEEVADAPMEEGSTVENSEEEAEVSAEYDKESVGDSGRVVVDSSETEVGVTSV
jgi:hypothetical protein